MNMKAAFVGMLAAASVATSAAVGIIPTLWVDGFTEYEAPDRLNITWWEYMQSASGGISPVPTDYPTWCVEYPYRALLVGARMTNDGTKVATPLTFVVYSKEPQLDLFDYSYRENRARNQAGHILADYTKMADHRRGANKNKPELFEIVQVAGTAYSGEMPRSLNVYLVTAPMYNEFTNIVYFDFYFPCCSNLEIKGLRNLTEVPYAYILTCDEIHGGPGGSTSGSSSEDGGSSSGGGGSSSGGDGGGSSSGGDGGSSSGGDGGGTSEPGRYPWEDDENIPDNDVSIPSGGGHQQGGEGDTGENGGGWTLPEWGTSRPDPPTINPPTMPDVSIPEIPQPGWEFPEIPQPDLEFPEYPDRPGFEFPEAPDPFEDDEPGGTWPPPFPGWRMPLLLTKEVL